MNGNNKARSGPIPWVVFVPLLKSRLTLRPVRGTSLVEIRAFSEDRAFQFERHLISFHIRSA